MSPITQDEATGCPQLEKRFHRNLNASCFFPSKNERKWVSPQMYRGQHRASLQASRLIYTAETAHWLTYVWKWFLTTYDEIITDVKSAKSKLNDEWSPAGSTWRCFCSTTHTNTVLFPDQFIVLPLNNTFQERSRRSWHFWSCLKLKRTLLLLTSHPK